MFGFKSKRNKIRENAARAFENNIQVLKEMDDEIIGEVLDMAAKIKSSSLLVASDDPYAEALYHDPVTVPEKISIQQLEIFERVMIGWTREGAKGLDKVAGLSVWYLSIAACTFSDQMISGRSLWKELSRGFPYVQRFDPEEDLVVGFEHWSKKSEEKVLPDIVNDYLGPTMALARFAEDIARYFKRVQDGKQLFPAYKDKDVGSSIFQVWVDTRLELLHHLWQNLDDFNPAILAEQTRQEELVACILEAGIEYDSYSVNTLKYASTVTNLSKEHKGMINAIIVMYEALLSISYEIDVSEDDIAMGRKSAPLDYDITSILEADQRLESLMGCKDLLENVKEINEEWINYSCKLGSNEPLPSFPKTLSEIIIEDISIKTRRIAFTAVMGSSYGKNFELVMEHGISAELAKDDKEVFDYLVNADSPEAFREWMDKRIGI